MADRSLLPAVFWSLLALGAALLFGLRLADLWPAGMADTNGVDLSRVILIHSFLPRAAVAIMAGAALGLSGLLLQRILRNPLAEPSTLGISASAQLAMATATIYAPALMEFSIGTVAFAGGIAAVALILTLTWRRGLEPVAVVLAGMMVALTANSLSAALILANGDYLFSLFIWGGGSLVQQGWEPTISIGLRLVLGLAAAGLLLRPLAILGLDDQSARNLGVAVHASRFAVIALAVWIATTVTADVGIIGFIGLAAPALATLSGARSLRQKLIASPLIGAILLWLTDGLVQLFSGPEGERVPTGAATALLGGPLLLWLLPRLKMFEWPSVSAPTASAGRAPRPGLIILLIVLGMLSATGVALLVGIGPQGWQIASGEAFNDLLNWRAPRVAVAAAAGGMLGAAGMVIQRVTANPLASPEILGVGAGAGAGMALALIFGATLGPQLLASAVGALTVLGVILWIGAHAGFGPERLLFAGIAMNALCSAVLTAMIALGNQQSYILLRWLSGSTNDTVAFDGLISVAGLVLLAGPLFLATRWLDLLPLGSPTAQALGLHVGYSRLVVIVLAALMTALTANYVGPLSFVGLIAPHLARLLGLGRARQQLAGAVALGALLMVLSDWLSRMVAFPYQLPLGIFASLIGGPYLIYLLGKGVQRHG
jgi:iron complex transport system permease protein